MSVDPNNPIRVPRSEGRHILLSIPADSEDGDTSSTSGTQYRSKEDHVLENAVTLESTEKAVAIPANNTQRYPVTNAFLKQIEYLAWLPSSQRSLLGHFVQNASGLTTCNSHGQAMICQMLVPKALKSPALLNALLTVAAVHKKSLTPSALERNSLGHAIRNLTQTSLQAFQIELNHSEPQKQTTLVAVALFLCEQSLHGAHADPKSWRAHMEGTKAILDSINKDEIRGDDRDLLEFSRRWYRAVESLAALSPRGLAPGPLGCSISQSLFHSHPLSNNYLDEYCGYNTNLNDVLLEIGALARKRHSSLFHGDHTPIEEVQWDMQADWLEHMVHELLYQSQVSQPSFFPGVASHLSPVERAEFSLCNQAYHHMALIHINCRIRMRPPSSERVQWSVEQILDCAHAISPSHELSPYLALTGPVFTAGCVAFGGTRDRVRNILTGLFTKVQSQSMLRSLELLEAFWKENGDYYFEDWDTYAGKSPIHKHSSVFLLIQPSSTQQYRLYSILAKHLTTSFIVVVSVMHYDFPDKCQATRGEGEFKFQPFAHPSNRLQLALAVVVINHTSRHLVLSDALPWHIQTKIRRTANFHSHFTSRPQWMSRHANNVDFEAILQVLRSNGFTVLTENRDEVRYGADDLCLSNPLRVGICSVQIFVLEWDFEVASARSGVQLKAFLFFIIG